MNDLYIKKGELFIVSTPIGNLDDITYRAVNILKDSDIIVAESLRKIRILLSKYKINNKKIIINNVKNEHKIVQIIINHLLNGNSISLISDSGTPALSDPGFLITREAIRNNIKVSIIPGVSSLTFAIAACNLPIEQFIFHGFLSKKINKRKKLLQDISNNEITNFIFISPHKILQIMQEITDIMPNAQVSVIREATKIHEEIIRDNAKNILSKLLNKKTIKGEITLAINNHYEQ